jgi:hypothetical protein
VKNNLFISLAGIVLATVTANCSVGQTTNSQAQYSTSANSSSADSENYNLNGKAVRDFTRTFNDVSGESWSSSPNGFTVTFTIHEINYVIFYDHTGDKLYTIRNYHEEKLPHEVRHLVKKMYHDYDIRSVQEVANDFGTTSAYFIHLEGRTEWITARISNGRVDEFERFNKAE